MLQEALEYLFSQAQEHADKSNARIVLLPGDGRKVTIEHNGNLVDRDVPPPLRKHGVQSVADLIAAAKKWNVAPVLWINENAAVLVIDDEDRRETVSLALSKSHIFSKIESLDKSNGGTFDQAALIRLLRREFRDAVGAATMLTAVRKIKFRQSAEGYANVQHGNESLGQSVENEVTGAGDIPESLDIAVNVFRNPGEESVEFTITLDLEVEAKAQKFILRPMPDLVEMAVANAVTDIRSRIEEALPGVAVFFGTP